MLSAAFVSAAVGIQRLPAGFATLALLPSAGAPVRAAPYTAPSVRRHTSQAQTINARISFATAPWHHDEPELSSLPAASRCRGQPTRPTPA